MNLRCLCFYNLGKQNIININRLFLFQKKLIRTINFKERKSIHTNFLFQNYNILKFSDRIKIANCLLISNSVHKKLLSAFNNWFPFSSNIHQYATSFTILKFQILKQLLMEKVPLLAWWSNHWYPEKSKRCIIKFI